MPAGFVAATNCENLGIALRRAGRRPRKKEDHIDPAVGLEFHARLGERVERGQPLVTIHYNADAKLAEAGALIAASYKIGRGSAEKSAAADS